MKKSTNYKTATREAAKEEPTRVRDANIAYATGISAERDASGASQRKQSTVQGCLFAKEYIHACSGPPCNPPKCFRSLLYTQGAEPHFCSGSCWLTSEQRGWPLASTRNVIPFPPSAKKAKATRHRAMAGSHSREAVSGSYTTTDIVSGGRVRYGHFPQFHQDMG